MGTECVISLIHGTFAKGAEWTKPSSFFSTEIKNKLGDVPIESPQWSGNNSHEDRLRDSKSIASQLLQICDKYPGKCHFIIAHSHGGTVTLYALRDAKLRSQIRGVVTLGTPFVECRPRSLSKAIKFFSALLGICFFLFMSTCWWIVVHTWFSHLLIFRIGKRTGGSPILGAGWGIVLWFAIRLYDVVSQNVESWSGKMQTRLAERFDLGTSFEWPRFWCAVVPGDEARAWLSSLIAVSGTPWTAFMVKLALTRTSIVGAVVLMLVYELMHGHIFLADLAIMAIYSAVLCIVSLIVYQIAAFILPGVLRAHKLVMGGESLLDNWMNRINITKMPSSDIVKSCELADDVRIPKEYKGMAHSWFVQDPNLIAQMGAWIKATASDAKQTRAHEQDAN